MHTSVAAGPYDEALERFHLTGPEFDGWLSNHGPMVVEALARRGEAARIHAWADAYSARLEDLPRPTHAILDGDWRDALGDPRRLADWVQFFVRRVATLPWSEVLEEWWPRLLPGIAGGATHGVIRVGHATQALRDRETAARVVELAHGLGYWAARWQEVPVAVPNGDRSAHDLVCTVPRVRAQAGGIQPRLALLPSTAGFLEHGERLVPPSGAAAVPAAIAGLVDAVVLAYPRLAVGGPTMLVHAATAPNAVLGTLPSLPESLWLPSFDAAWAATAAVLAAYRPEVDGTPVRGPRDADEAWATAVRNGSEHVIKLAATTLDVHERTGRAAALDAIATAISLEA